MNAIAPSAAGLSVDGIELVINWGLGSIRRRSW